MLNLILNTFGKQLKIKCIYLSTKHNFLFLSFTVRHLCVCVYVRFLSASKLFKFQTRLIILIFCIPCSICSQFSFDFVFSYLSVHVATFVQLYNSLYVVLFFVSLIIYLIDCAHSTDTLTWHFYSINFTVVVQELWMYVMEVREQSFV